MDTTSHVMKVARAKRSDETELIVLVAWTIFPVSVALTISALSESLSLTIIADALLIKLVLN